MFRGRVLNTGEGEFSGAEGYDSSTILLDTSSSGVV